MKRLLVISLVLALLLSMAPISVLAEESAPVEAVSSPVEAAPVETTVETEDVPFLSDLAAESAPLMTEVVATVAAESEPIAELQATVQRGDVNGDELIDAKDVTILRRHLAGGYDVAADKNASDANGDGTLNAKDVTILRRYIAGGYDVELAPLTVLKFTYTDAVTGGRLYQDLGGPQFGSFGDAYTLSAGVDGVNRSDLPAVQAAIVSGNIMEISPIGSFTEVLMDLEEKTITISTSKYYTAMIADVIPAVTDASGEVTREAYVTLKKIDGNPIPSGRVEFKDGTMASQCFITDAYTTADRNATLVVYTKGLSEYGDGVVIKSLDRAEVRSGKAGSRTMDISGRTLAFELDDKEYPVANTAAAYALEFVYGADATIYLDPNGNILYAEATFFPEAIAYVLSAGQMTDHIYGDVTTGANLLFTDGTTQRVNVYNANGSKYRDDEAWYLAGKVVSYYVTADGEYVLDVLPMADSYSYGYSNTIEEVVNRNPNLAGSTMYANTETKFIVESTEETFGAINYSYNVYTGIQNVPTVTEAAYSGRLVIAAVNSRTAPNVADYVFVVGGKAPVVVEEPKLRYTGEVTGGTVYADLGGIRFGTGEGEYSLQVIAGGCDLGEDLVKAFAERISDGNDKRIAEAYWETDIYVNETRKTVRIETWGFPADMLSAEAIAYVLTAGQQTDHIYGDVTTGANLLFTDGTTQRVNVYNENGSKYSEAGAWALTGKVVSYYVTADGEYVLDVLPTATANTYGCNNQITAVYNNEPNLSGSSMLANANTKFIVESSEVNAYGAITYEYTLYTGVQNVPTVTEASDYSGRFVIAAVNSPTAPTTAAYVFVIGGLVQEEAEESVFVFMRNFATDCAKTDGDNNIYFITTAVVAGEIKTVKMTHNAYMRIGNALSTFSAMTVDKNGYITDLMANNMDGYVKEYTAFAVGGEYNNGIIVMQDADYATCAYYVEPDVPVYVFDNVTNTVTQTPVSEFFTTKAYQEVKVVFDANEMMMNGNAIVAGIYVSLGLGY